MCPSFKSNLLPVFTFLLFGFSAQAQLQIHEFSLDTNSHFRGISAVGETVCWFSGSNGSVFRIQYNGREIIDCSPEGYEDLDFRDIQAFTMEEAVIISAGLPAVILKTEDGGKSWKEVYRNEEKGVFFDAMDFWDPRRGIAFSDAQGEDLLIIETRDGGETWTKIPSENIPKVHSGQGGFAASGTCLKAYGQGQVIIGLGGPEATVLLSDDYGVNWFKTTAPIDYGEGSKGIFSFDYIDERTVLAVGGDYRADSLSNSCFALSDDGGRSWSNALGLGLGLVGKYRSSIVALDDTIWLAISRTGTSYTVDAGKTWKEYPYQFYSTSKTRYSLWVSGSKGRVGKITILR